SLGPQELGRAAPLVAEDEIIADDHGLDAEAFDQDRLDEGLGALLGEIEIEMQGEEIIDAQSFERPRLGAERRQTKGRRARLEDAARMRLEGEHGEPRARL